MNPARLHAAGIGFVICGVSVHPEAASEGAYYWSGSRGHYSAIVSYVEGLPEPWLVRVTQWAGSRSRAIFTWQSDTLERAYDRITEDLDRSGAYAALGGAA